MESREKERDGLDYLRRDHFAGSAPSCERVEDDDFVILESGLEFGFAGNGRC
jgi:hypothetical protein